MKRYLWWILSAAVLLPGLVRAEPARVPGSPSALAPAWNKILQAYVSPKDGRVDYKGLAQNPADLENFLKAHEALDPRTWNDDEKKAVYINLYNAMMIANLLRYAKEHPIYDPAGSEFLKIEINNIKLAKGNIWNGEYSVMLARKAVTLDDIEHGLIRNQEPKTWGELAVKNLDPRIHAAVNCAAMSCPRVREKAYEPEMVDAMLDENIREFINNPNQFAKLSESQMRANSIVLWYYSDFDSVGKNNKLAGAGDYLAQFVDAKRPDAAWFKKHLQTKFNDRWPLSLRMSSDFDFSYDWRVNDQRN